MVNVLYEMNHPPKKKKKTIYQFLGNCVRVFIDVRELCLYI